MHPRQAHASGRSADPLEVEQERPVVARRHHAVDHLRGRVHDGAHDDQVVADLDQLPHRDAHPDVAAVALEGLAAILAETLLLLAVAAQALHRKDVVHALLDGARGDGARRPRRLRAPSRHTREADGQEKDAREHAGEEKNEAWRFGVGAHERADGHEHDRHRHHDGVPSAVEALVDGWRVVHDTVDAVADALLFQGRHRQCLDPFEQS